MRRRKAERRGPPTLKELFTGTTLNGFIEASRVKQFEPPKRELGNEFNMQEMYERTYRKAIFKPLEEHKPPIPPLVFNPHLKKAVARLKAQVLPMKTEGGRIISYPKVVNPQIEFSPFFKTLSRSEKETIIEHELLHLFHAQAFPGRRQLHREGSLFSMEKTPLRWKP